MNVPDDRADPRQGHLLTDAVTGALSRASFELRLSQEVERSRRSGATFSLCLFDVDHFKSVNDAFGHLRGDEVLRHVAQRVAGLLRGSDVVFRFGGDEFVVLLPEASRARAAEVALRIVEGVASDTLAGTPPLRVSISLGVASFPSDAAEAPDLVAVADSRAYLAKRRGRGCVVANDDAGDAPAALPPLLERDDALAAVQDFLAQSAAQGPGVLRVGGARGAGHSRFVEEVAKIAGLRGLEVLRIAGQEPQGASPYNAPTESLPELPAAAPATSGVPGALVIADGEAAWSSATEAARRWLAAGVPTVGLVLAGPGSDDVAVSEEFPLRAAVQLAAWAPATVRVWLRTRLPGEPSPELVDHLCALSGGLPARAERALTRLVDGGGVERRSDTGWRLTDPAPVPRTGRTLPRQPTELVGRGVEIDQVMGLLAAERLVTLTGPGGIGKTRLALAVAADVEDRYDDGMVFVPLAETTTAGQVERAVALALEVNERAEKPLSTTIAEHLADRHLLLILDNFEHVHTAAVQVAAWLTATKALTVLVTSRERLRLSAERLYAVPSLTLPALHTQPPPPESVSLALAQSSALALFAARAQRAAYDFTLTPANLPAVAELCHRLDGLPLALELAAAHLDTMTPEELLTRLAGHLDLLADGPQDVPARQQTLRAAIGWSYDLLDPADRKLFNALAVFPGGCRLDALAAVCPTDQLAERMAGLVDKSLVIGEADPGGEPRFRTLRIIRAYAAEQLAAAAESTHARHAAHYAAFAERAGGELLGPDQANWRDLVTREQHNIRAALGRSLQHGDPQTAARICAGIWVIWATSGEISEGREWLDRALAERDHLPPGLLAKMLYAAGALALMRGDVREAGLVMDDSLHWARAAGDRSTMTAALRKLGRIRSVAGEYEQAADLCEESLTLARADRDQRAIAAALVDLGDIAIRLGRLEQGQALMLEALVLVRASGHTLAILDCVASLGEILMFRGDVAAARPFFEECLTLAGELGDVSAEAWVLHHFGKLAELEGDRREAVRLFTKALSRRHEIEERHEVADSLEALARLSLDSEPPLAARLFGAAAALRNEQQLTRPPILQREWDDDVRLLDETLEPAARRQAWTAGEAAPLDQIVAEALALGPAQVPRSSRRPPQ